MSRLDALISRLCPNGVLYKPLLDVCDILYGYPCDASKFNTNQIGNPLARIRDVLKGETDTYTSEKIPDKYRLSAGDLLIGMDGNFHVSKWKMDGGFLCQRVCKLFSKDESVLSNGFLYHLIGPIIKKIEDSKQSGTVKHLLDKDIKGINVPVPPMEVQDEIVRILDGLADLSSALIENLSAELLARKKQYEFYRRSLIFDNALECERVPLSSTAHYSTQRVPYTDLSEANYVGVENLLQNRKGRIDSLCPPTSGNCTRYDEGDILIGNIRPYLKKIWFADRPGGASGDVLVVVPKGKAIDPKFLYYVLSSDEFFSFDNTFSKGAKMPRGDKQKIMSFMVPVLPLKEQRRVVQFLDSFEGYFFEISNGLSTEIDARKKQYEYYRDRLLSFREAKA